MSICTYLVAPAQQAPLTSSTVWNNPPPSNCKLITLLNATNKSSKIGLNTREKMVKMFQVRVRLPQVLHRRVCMQAESCWAAMLLRACSLRFKILRRGFGGTSACNTLLWHDSDALICTARDFAFPGALQSSLALRKHKQTLCADLICYNTPDKGSG